MKLRVTFFKSSIIILSVFVFMQLGCKTNSNKLVSEFPMVSKAIAITSGPNEHLFASYYGINSWSADQRYVTVLQTPFQYRLPNENDAAILGLVDLETNEFIPL
ncbi:MAG: hypothetical protein GQ525_10655, partial [Draconibacterium sp.]|nr:hypothetical protein [Draconibacterium sp.]